MDFSTDVKTELKSLSVDQLRELQETTPKSRMLGSNDSQQEVLSSAYNGLIHCLISVELKNRGVK
jgi:hypothetical protein